jgi:hypothetical protein
MKNMATETPLIRLFVLAILISMPIFVWQAGNIFQGLAELITALK